jgi:iron complex outermembrane receptor protein
VVPIEGLTLTANLGYTDFTLTKLNAGLGLPALARPSYIPKWTGNTSVQYEIRDMPGDSRLVMRLDANYKSKMWLAATNVTPDLESVMRAPAAWIVNARVALADLKVAGGTAEVALWGRNLTDEDHLVFAAAFPLYVAGSYERARTYGVDISFKY